MADEATIQFREAVAEIQPAADSIENAHMSDVIGNKEDAASDTAEVTSLIALLRKALQGIKELEDHIHNVERWFGRSSAPVAGVNEGENASMIPFMSVIEVGETFGAWVPLLGTGDTPNQAGMLRFDLHQIEISDIVKDLGDDPNKHIHYIQIAWGASGAAGLALGNYTELMTVPEKDGKASPINMLMPQLGVGEKVFLRHRVTNRDTQAIIDGCSMKFFHGLHEYM